MTQLKFSLLSNVKNLVWNTKGLAGIFRMSRHFFVSRLEDAWEALLLSQDNAQEDFLSDLCMEAAVYKNKPREQVLKQIKHADKYMHRL